MAASRPAFRHGNIDLVSFDNYLPLSDWTTGDGGLDALNWTQPRRRRMAAGFGDMNGLGLTGADDLQQAPI